VQYFKDLTWLRRRRGQSEHTISSVLFPTFLVSSWPRGDWVPGHGPLLHDHHHHRQQPDSGSLETSAITRRCFSQLVPKKKLLCATTALLCCTLPTLTPLLLQVQPNVEPSTSLHPPTWSLLLLPTRHPRRPRSPIPPRSPKQAPSSIYIGRSSRPATWTRSLDLCLHTSTAAGESAPLVAVLSRYNTSHTQSTSTCLFFPHGLPSSQLAGPLCSESFFDLTDTRYLDEDTKWLQPSQACSSRPQ
jgi:hypothetical protein